MLVELRGLRGGGGTAQRNKKGPSTWSSHGPSAHRAWRSWNKGTSSRTAGEEDFTKRLKVLRRKVENDEQRLERQIEEELMKENADEAKVLQLWDALRLMRGVKEDAANLEIAQRSFTEEEVKKLRETASIPKTPGNNFEVVVKNKWLGMEWSFFTNTNKTVEELVETVIQPHLNLKEFSLHYNAKNISDEPWRTIGEYVSNTEVRITLDILPILRGGGRSVKDTKGKQAERKQRAKFAEIAQQAEVVHDMAQTDKDVESLKVKIRELTKEMNESGTPLMNVFRKMSPLEITMLMTEIASSSNMETRITNLTQAVLPETKRITEKATSLQETVQVAEMTVRLAYDAEFATGRGYGKETGLIPTLKQLAQGGMNPGAKKASADENPSILRSGI